MENETALDYLRDRKYGLSQEEMERYFREKMQMIREKFQGSINASMCPYLESCNFQERKLICSYRLPPEYADATGKVLGRGMINVALDNSMGYLSGYFAYNMTPTISMTVAYLHPVSMEYPLLMEACADRLSDHINYMSVRAYQPDCPERILAEASGSYAVS